MKEFNHQDDAFAKAWQEALSGAEQAPSASLWDRVAESMAGDATAAAAAALFDDAEVPPSPEVWDKVESTLAHDRAALYQLKMRRAQYLAAAAIALLLLLGGNTLFRNWNSTRYAAPMAVKPYEPAVEWETLQNYLDPSTTDQGVNTNSMVASLEPQGNDTPTELAAESAPQVLASTSVSSEASPANQPQISTELPQQGTQSTVLASAEAHEPTPIEDSNSLVVEQESKVVQSPAPTLIAPAQPILASAEAYPSQDRMIYINPQYVNREEVQPESKALDPVASLALTGGYFSPNYRSQFMSEQGRASMDNFVSPFAIEAVNQLENSIQGGISQSVAVGVGLPLAKRWILNIGAQLGLFRAKGQSHYTFQDNGETIPTTTSTFEALSASYDYQNQPRVINNYEVTENYTLASMPVQAGFLVHQGKVDVWLTAGASADIFLQNKVVSEWDQFATQKYSILDGNASPYQPVMVSGVVGTEVNYQLSPAWSVSVAPSVKMTLNSLAKEGEAFTGTPTFVDMGLRLKYHGQ